MLHGTSQSEEVLIGRVLALQTTSWPLRLVSLGEEEKQWCAQGYVSWNAVSWAGPRPVAAQASGSPVLGCGTWIPAPPPEAIPLGAEGWESGLNGEFLVLSVNLKQPLCRQCS